MPSLRSQILARTLQRVTDALNERFSLQERRTRLDELGRRGIRLPREILVRSVQARGVHAEWVESSRQATTRVILYLHGGGYCFCSPNTHRGLAARLAMAAQARALLVDYRLAPEYPFPAALEDALASYFWLLDEGIAPNCIVIAGDSAGGGLTLATAVRLRDDGAPLPAALVCISPWTDLTFSGESIRALADVDPVLRWRELPSVRYYTGDYPPDHPLISPLFADLSALPPTLIHVGSREILLDDSRRLAAKMKAAGVDVTLEIWPGMWHVFPIFAPFVPEAEQSIAKIGAFIRECTREEHCA